MSGCPACPDCGEPCSVGIDRAHQRHFHAGSGKPDDWGTIWDDAGKVTRYTARVMLQRVQARDMEPLKANRPEHGDWVGTGV
jgi:hypothetical protein